MAARRVPIDRAWTPQKVRDRIQTGLIVKRLEDHILGEQELSKTQVSAALILLKKTLPDLQSMELRGDPNAPIRISTVDGNL